MDDILFRRDGKVIAGDLQWGTWWRLTKAFQMRCSGCTDLITEFTQRDLRKTLAWHLANRHVLA